jgi:hypothetical protein
MSLKYVFDQDESQLRRDPLADGETVTEGEFVYRNGSGELEQFDPANDALPSGIVVHHVGSLSDALVEHDEDYVPYEDLYTFDAADGDAPYYLPLKVGQTIQPETVTATTDANGNTPPEPSIGDGKTVGIITGPSGETRIVEEGYTYDVDDDGTAETYSESGDGDFVALGEIYQEPQYKRLEDNYDQRVPVYLSAETFQA